MAKEILVGLDTFSLKIMGKVSIICKKRVYVKKISTTEAHYYQDNIEINEKDYNLFKEEYDNLK